ncbi:VOC family protein [Staphylococcus sp. SQ8-PEA]|uniref:VOC family protein n=1 Tax=Staphylococcus marylandisciuri TaxID=2981529 RepID=A0ABT2QNI1_9STAP|nr:VOC family protein [Staphylococcus marylandisciuri]MCU5745532.1 VOC family protein [Staphylococcus marylandisciuri]
MQGLRSVTLGTKDMEATIDFFHNQLGLNETEKNGARRFGDAHLSPGTRLHFVEVPNYDEEDHHIYSLGLRVPTDEALLEYQEILDDNGMQYSEMSMLNTHKCFHFYTKEGLRIDIYSDELNSGTPLGTPSTESTVNPLHQIQGLGPVILRVNDLLLTRSVLSKVFGIEAFAEYTLAEDEEINVLVFQIGDGGLGGEMHLYKSPNDLELPEAGVIEQIEFSTHDRQQYQRAIDELDDVGIPYQTLNQDTTQSLRINEASGIAFILTLEHN